MFFTQPILASNGRTTYQGKIYKPDGYPLEAANVDFRFTVLDPSGSCVLYIEDYPDVNMVGSGGFISLSLGTGSRAYPTSGTLTFSQVFDNTVPMFTCQSPGFYNPAATDNRKLVMQFNDNNGWQTLPAMAINAVPYAMYADKSTDAAKLNGKADTDFVEVTTLANLNCTAGQAIQYTGSGFACIDAGDPNAVTNFAVSGSVLTLAGTASSPILGITAASASTDGYLLSSDYNEFKAKMDNTAAAIASALGYSPVSAAAVSSMISSATDPSFTTMSNSISTLQSDLAAVSASAGNALIKSNNLSDLASATVARTNLGLGDLSILNVIDLSTTQATGIIADARLQDFVSVVSGTQYTKLTVDGKGRVVSGAQLDSSDVITALGYTPANSTSGITSFNGSSSQTQTLANSLTGTTPAFVTNNGVHTLNIPYASEATTTAGLISNSEYSTFMNKITSSAASIAQVLGYTPAASSTVDALQAQLDAVSGTAGNALVKSNNLSDLASATVARTNLGLGDLSILNVIDLSTSQATGIIADARLQDFVSVVSGTQYTKLTVDGKGRVVSGAQLDSADVIAALGYTPGSAASGITSFNGSSSQTQTLANSLTGTTPAFVTNNGVHTLNIPYASEATTTAGLISNFEYSTFMNKITSSAASIAQVLGYVPAASSTVDALQAQLDAVSGTAGNALVKSNNLSDLASATVARTNLGLGSVATLNSIDLSSTQATGIVSDARLADQSGVVSGTQYTKVTVDGKGRVVSGAQLASSDVTTALGYTPAESGTITSSQWTTSGSTINYMTGNVGIGTTTPTSATLYVKGSSSGTGLATLIVQNSAAYASPFNQYSQLWINDVGTTIASLRQDGSFNTAAGISAGAYSASGGSASNVAFKSVAGGAGTGMYFPAANTLALSTASTEALRIDSSGNVGIGTASPVTKLSVSGGIQISMESATCAVSYAGAMRYNTGSLEFCNGSTWAALGVAGSGVQSFNGSTSGTQSFANSLTGTTPAFVTNNGVHTLNIPYASEATTTAGLISNSDFVNFTNKLSIANNLSDLASATVARTNLGLGSVATLNSIDLSSTQATGIVSDARLADQSGVVSGTQYTKVTVDGKGRVVSGAQLASSDVTTALGYTPASASASTQWTTSGSTIYYNTGNVGIGTNNPTSRLTVGDGTTSEQGIHINALTSPLIRFQQGGVNKYGIISGDGMSFHDYTAGIARLSINSTGNVGIGTSSASAKLEIVTSLNDGVSGGLRISNGAWTASGRPSVDFHNSHPSANFTSAQLSSEIGASGNNSDFIIKVADSSKVLQSRLYINKDGNIAIGSTSPATKLSVSGGLQISMESGVCAVGLAGTLRYNAGNVEFCNGSTWAAFGVAGSGITSFNGSTSGTQSFANSLTGTTPAFVTNNGVHTLNIPYASEATTTAGLISNAEYANFSNKITSSAASIAQVLGYVPAASGVISSQWNTSGTTINYMAGNVGVGTTTPQSPFQVYISGTSQTAARITQSGAVTAPNILALELLGNSGLDRGPGLLFKTPTSAVSAADGGRVFVAGESPGTNTYMAFSTATTNVLSEKMRITSTGNVGIGTTAPITKLSVSGGVQISMESATCAVSYAGTLRYNAGNVEFCNGSSWAAFGVSGAGLQSFNGSTSGTQTFANGTSGNSPAFVTANGVHTLNIPYASVGTTTAGLISNADYVNFSNKITSSAASVAEVLGYTPANSATVTTLSSNISSVSSTVNSVSSTVSSLQSSTAASFAAMTSSQWTTSGTNIYYNTGNIGVGTSAPVGKLHLEDVDNNVRLYLRNTSSTATRSVGVSIINHMGTAGTSATPDLTFYNFRGNVSAVADAQSGDTLGILRFGASGGGVSSFGATIESKAAANWSSGSKPAYMAFSTIPSGSSATVERLRIDSSGYIGIGTSAPTQMLEVAGNINVGSQVTRTTASTNRGQLAAASTYVQTAATSATVNWNNGNIQEISTFVCNGTNTITMTNTRDGAAYSILLSGATAHSGVCVFSAAGMTFKTSGGAAAPTSGRDILFTFAVINNIVIYNMTDNLQ